MKNLFIIFLLLFNGCIFIPIYPEPALRENGLLVQGSSEWQEKNLCKNLTCVTVTRGPIIVDYMELSRGCYSNATLQVWNRLHYQYSQMNFLYPGKTLEHSIYLGNNDELLLEMNDSVIVTNNNCFFRWSGYREL